MGSAASTKKDTAENAPPEKSNSNAANNAGQEEGDHRKENEKGGGPLTLDTGEMKGWGQFARKDVETSPRSPGESFRVRSVSKMSMRMSWVDMVDMSEGAQIHLVENKNTLFDNFRQRSLQSLDADFKKQFESIKGDDGNRVVLGSGMEGKVYLVSRKEDSRRFALKTLDLSEAPDMSKNFELNHLTKMDHPRIVKIMDVFSEERSRHLLAFEVGLGGDMFAFIHEVGPVPEQRAAPILRQILQCVHYMHLRNIVHRDLKLENFVFRTKNSDDLLLIDFGLSSSCSAGQNLRQKLGTIHYMAPEVFKRSYSFEVDMWAVGVITFMLLSARRPFRGKKDEEIIENILAANFSFDGDQWKHVSDSAKDFISNLLKLDAKSRLSPLKALQHPWIATQVDPPMAGSADAQVKETILAKFMKFDSLPLLKQFALQIIAYELPFEKTKWAMPYFDWLVNADPGVVTFDRLRQVFPEEVLPEDVFNRLFDSLDHDNKMYFTWTSFLAAFVEPSVYANDKFLLLRVFKKLSSHSGQKRIGVSDLAFLFGASRKGLELGEIINEAKYCLVQSPVNNEYKEKITWQDFVRLMRKNVSSLTQEEKEVRNEIRRRSLRSTTSSEVDPSNASGRTLNPTARSEETQSTKEGISVISTPKELESELEPSKGPEEIAPAEKVS